MESRPAVSRVTFSVKHLHVTQNESSSAAELWICVEHGGWGSKSAQRAVMMTWAHTAKKKERKASITLQQLLSSTFKNTDMRGEPVYCDRLSLLAYLYLPKSNSISLFVWIVLQPWIKRKSFRITSFLLSIFETPCGISTDWEPLLQTTLIPKKSLVIHFNPH